MSSGNGNLRGCDVGDLRDMDAENEAGEERTDEERDEERNEERDED